ncbi:Acyl-protein thioesterase 1 [Penicillium canariense]|uniref:Acyl-protein thioesterase 1 n=1 Tax=Penicillium canariense TaxID=189055 RepID=A0A9W9LML1_9EURO|nr:Acyl-protein thioesterase 1 [Penicillium canariense]KAJ5166211.1 Acyl-protein thioesterase 1 [Penicillium canariense]
MTARAPLVVPALTKHTATVIMAHGLGDSGAGWMALAHNWRRRGKFDEVAFIFPNAPNIPITVNMGLAMPGWYDIAHLGRDVNTPLRTPCPQKCSPNQTKDPLTVRFFPFQLDFEDNVRSQDEPGILHSRDYFNSLIKEQTDKGIKPSRIVLGGFSQGGAMSVFTGVTAKEKLGGVFGLSCYLLLSDRIKNFVPEEWPNKKTPFFLGHGDEDEVVKYAYGERSAKMLKEIGLEDVSFNTYPGLGHSADPDEVSDLEKFLEKTIPPEGDGRASSGL